MGEITTNICFHLCQRNIWEEFYSRKIHDKSM